LYSGNKGGCHPSDQIPALLAVAESEDASGQELIESISLAYDVMCGGVASGVTQKNGFDYVIWGVLGTILGAGKLMKLTDQELKNAVGIGIAANNTLEVARLGDLSMWKGVAQAYGCHNAVQACQMAREGVTGPNSVFDGPNGFFDVVSDGPIDLALSSGKHKILETSLKPHAACGATISTIQSVIELTTENNISPADISGIEIQTYSKAVEMCGSEDKWSTDLNRETADHSFAYTASIAALDGQVWPQQFSPNKLNDSTVHELMKKVTVEASNELDSHVASHSTSRPAEVTIHANGDTYHQRRYNYRGHPSEPFTDAELEDKFTELSSPYLTNEQSRQTIEACRNLATHDTIKTIMAKLNITA
jgi:2-methylcitrate dehydratase